MYLLKDRNNNRVLFIHIPKCAGTHMHTILDYSEPRVGRGYSIPDRYYYTHIPLQFAKGITSWDYSIAVVRNPYERYVSRFNYIKTENQLVLADLDIDTLIKWDRTGRYLANSPLVRPFYHNWSVESSRQQIEYISVAGEIKVDQIHKLEEIEPYDFLCNLTGKVLYKPECNLGVSKKFVEDLTEKQKRKVYGLYSEDFHYLGYEK